MTEIKDRVETTVSGTVARVFFYNGGMAVDVEVQNPKLQYPDRYTVWNIANTLVSAGDRIKVKGVYSDKCETFTKKDGSTGYGIKRSLNFPEILEQVHGVAPTHPSVAPVTAEAGQVTALFPNDSEAPF
jgi:hypothetical protein